MVTPSEWVSTDTVMANARRRLDRPMEPADPIPNRRDLDYAVVAFDFGLIGAIGALVVGFELLASEALKASLTHETGVGTALSLFGHAFVHYAPGDMVWNLLGYLVLSLLAYALALGVDERQWILLSLVSVVVVVPPVTGLSDSVVFGILSPEQSVSIRGFSAVVAGLAGTVFVAYLGLLRRLYDTVVLAIVGGMFLLGLAGVIARLYTTWPPMPFAVSLLVAGGLLVLRGGWRSGWEPGAVDSPRLLVSLLAGVVVGVALFTAVLVLFPAEFERTGSFTNVYGHAAGWFTGMVVAWWGHRYWTRTSWW